MYWRYSQSSQISQENSSMSIQKLYLLKCDYLQVYLMVVIVVARALHGHCTGIICALHGHCMGIYIARTLHGHCTDIVWELHGHCIWHCMGIACA